MGRTEQLNIITETVFNTRAHGSPRFVALQIVQKLSEGGYKIVAAESCTCDTGGFVPCPIHTSED